MEWLKNVFNFWKKKPKFITSVRWGFYCAVANVGDNEYRVIASPGIGQYDFLISIRGIAEIPELLVYANNRIFPMAGDGYSRLFGVTHRFTVSRIFNGGAISFIGIWDVCIGDGSINQEKYAARILKNTAYRILAVSHYTNKTEDMTWQGQVNRINWIGLLEQQAKIEYYESFDIKARKIYPQN